MFHLTVVADLSTVAQFPGWWQEAEWEQETVREVVEGWKGLVGSQ